MNKAINQILSRVARKVHPKSQDSSNDVICCPNCGHEFQNESGTGQATEDEATESAAMMTPGKIWLQRNKQRRR